MSRIYAALKKAEEKAQTDIITIAKRLADEGRIFILDEDEIGAAE